MATECSFHYFQVHRFKSSVPSQFIICVYFWAGLNAEFLAEFSNLPISEKSLKR